MAGTKRGRVGSQNKAGDTGRGIPKQSEVSVDFILRVKECMRGRRVFKQVLALFYLKNRSIFCSYVKIKI